MPKKDFGNDERAIVFCFIGEVGKRMLKVNLILVLKIEELVVQFKNCQLVQ